MRHRHLQFGQGFRVVITNRRSQAAQMVLAPGESEGDRDNRHRDADQWLYVVQGKGTALLNDRRHVLRAGTLLLIEQGDRHEIRNTGRTPLKTLNLYSPPAYTPAGNPRRAGKR
ncbi:MAG TPA: cupin domain-containing protein [Steroidobacteraceae bacterium]|jgi:mannose-6-phosphate isomerase-like protein (cupin superfamily)